MKINILKQYLLTIKILKEYLSMYKILWGSKNSIYSVFFGNKQNKISWKKIYIFPFTKTTSILIYDVTVNSKEKGMLDMHSKVKYCHFYLEALRGDDNSKEKGIIRDEYNG